LRQILLQIVGIDTFTFLNFGDWDMSNLTETEVRALHEALDDEYRSWSTYDQVIADFGETPPFSNIREAEGRHIEALCNLFVHYKLPVPANSWPGKVPRYTNLQEACQAAVEAEIANSKMYNRLINATQRQDILTVLHNLQEASQQRHLPAFQRCCTGDEGRGNGHRAMHRRGKERQV
jgi:hypothetical protein